MEISHSLHCTLYADCSHCPLVPCSSRPAALQIAIQHQQPASAGCIFVLFSTNIKTGGKLLLNVPWVVCSTYYSFCGNAGLKQKDGSAGEFRAAMCNKWLHPVAIRDHPAFASWVLYGMHTHTHFWSSGQFTNYPSFVLMCCWCFCSFSRASLPVYLVQYQARHSASTHAHTLRHTLLHRHLLYWIHLTASLLCCFRAFQ